MPFPYNCGSLEGEQERRMCYSRLAGLLEVLLEIKLARLLETLRDLEVPIPGRPWPEEHIIAFKELKEESEIIKTLQHYSRKLRDPTPEPIDEDKLLRTLLEALRGEMKHIEKALQSP